MDLDLSLDVVAFELVDIGAAARLAEVLAERWEVELNSERRETMLVLIDLRPDPADLALLLREVEAWVKAESALAIRYELDGRAYVLAAGEGPWLPDFSKVTAGPAGGQRARLLDALCAVERLQESNRAGPAIRGIEGLRRELDFALRLIDQSS